MGDWNRSTRDSSFDSFPPGMRAAIKSHVEQYNLGPILSDALLSIETRSEKIRKGLFGKAQTVLTAVVLTPRWLVWAIQDGTDQPAAVSARLADIVVTDFSKSGMAQFVQDTGLEVTGEFTGSAHGLPSEQRGSIFIGLGREPAAQKFQNALIAAVQDVKK
jgi:hypothetical protein